MLFDNEVQYSLVVAEMLDSENDMVEIVKDRDSFKFDYAVFKILIRRMIGFERFAQDI